jgi:DNA-binding transcriptional LysR family regulator
MIDLVSLRSFAHVCEVGTVAAAADRLGYTPPAVSQHIARLERDVGVPLFDRVAGRLRPSDHGRALQAIAAQMLDLAEQCHHLDAAAPQSTAVTVAGCASAITELVVPRLAPLAAVTVTVRGMDDERALRDLRLGRADVAIVQQYEPVAVERNPRLAYTAIATEPLRLVLPPDRSPATTLADLDQAPWLLNGDDTACTRAVLRLLAEAGITPAIAGSVDDNQALLRLVATGVGAAIVPDLVLAGAAPPPGLMVATALPGAQRTILAVTRRSTTARHQPLLDALTGGDRRRSPRSAHRRGGGRPGTRSRR